MSESEFWAREEDAFYARHGHESDVECSSDVYCFVRDRSTWMDRAEARLAEQSALEAAEVVRVKDELL